jgi:hypothetical protein
MTRYRTEAADAQTTDMDSFVDLAARIDNAAHRHRLIMQTLDRLQASETIERRRRYLARVQGHVQRRDYEAAREIMDSEVF